jgi:hypothetical protein
MSIVIALAILIVVVGAFALVARTVQSRNTGRDDRPLGDTPEAHDEISPHDVPKWDRATRMAAEEQSGGLEGETGGNEQGEAGGPAMSRGGTAQDG